MAKNVFWQVGGAVTIGTTAHFEGIVLGKTLIAVNTGAVVNGQLFAQTAVTLQQNTVNQPAGTFVPPIIPPVIKPPPVIYPPPHKPPKGHDGKKHGDDGKHHGGERG